MMQWKPLLMSVAVATLFAGCASKPKPETPTTPPLDRSVVTPQAAPFGSGVSDQSTMGRDPLNDPLRDPKSLLSKRSVYFDYDSNVIKNEYQAIIDAHAMFLKANPTRKATIQGNTDARGSREYNLALGQRRAEAVKQAMGVLGVSDAQLEAVSFGKEKPKASGSSEADYAENRRDDIVYDGE